MVFPCSEGRSRGQLQHSISGIVRLTTCHIAVHCKCHRSYKCHSPKINHHTPRCRPLYIKCWAEVANASVMLCCGIVGPWTRNCSLSLTPLAAWLVPSLAGWPGLCHLGGKLHIKKRNNPPPLPARKSKTRNERVSFERITKTVQGCIVGRETWEKRKEGRAGRLKSCTGCERFYAE